MRILRKTALTILAALPVPTLSIAAHSQLLAMAGDEQNSRLQEQLKTAKRMLFPPGSVITSFESARTRVKSITGIDDDPLLDTEVSHYVDKMMANGLLEVREDMLVSRIPSW